MGMPGESTEEENVFGESDGTSYSAVLGRTEQGGFTVRSLLVDGHNIPVKEAVWPSREQAVDAVRAYARGDVSS